LNKPADLISSNSLAMRLTRFSFIAIVFGAKIGNMVLGNGE